MTRSFYLHGFSDWDQRRWDRQAPSVENNQKLKEYSLRSHVKTKAFEIKIKDYGYLNVEPGYACLEDAVPSPGHPGDRAYRSDRMFIMRSKTQRETKVITIPVNGRAYVTSAFYRRSPSRPSSPYIMSRRLLMVSGAEVLLASFPYQDLVNEVMEDRWGYASNDTFGIHKNMIDLFRENYPGTKWELAKKGSRSISTLNEVSPISQYLPYWTDDAEKYVRYHFGKRVSQDSEKVDRLWRYAIDTVYLENKNFLEIIKT